MKRTFTAKEKAFVFDLWKRGTAFSEIVRILDSKPGTIFTMLRNTGGIKLSERRRAVAHLTLSEREEIRAGLSARMSIRAIACSLNRSPSTISREVQHNRGRRGYKAVDANNRANQMTQKAQGMPPGAESTTAKSGAGKTRVKMVSGADLWVAKKDVPPPEHDLRRFIKRCIFAIGVRCTICLLNIIGI